jgi:hypothetical protein
MFGIPLRYPITHPILEALERNKRGELFSIDLPPLDEACRKQVGMAVGDRFADRWTYVKGSSRRHLPALFSELGEIDLFIHDSLHNQKSQFGIVLKQSPVPVSAFAKAAGVT